MIVHLVKRKVLFGVGVAVGVAAVSADYLGWGNPGMGKAEQVVLLIGFLLVGASFIPTENKKLRVFKDSALALIVFAGIYGVLELGATLHQRYIKKTADGSLAFLSQNAHQIYFDPISGYRLPEGPIRLGRITKGRVEFDLSFAANKQGFVDTTDFTLKKPKETQVRYLAFGDSFSAQYVGTPWSEQTEVLLGQKRKTEIMNTALAAMGVANWWSLTTKEFLKKDYDLDGILFVLLEANLDKKFFVRDCTQSIHCLATSWHSWDPATYPKTLEEAKKHMKPEEAFKILSNLTYTKAMMGDFATLFPWRGVITQRVRNTLKRFNKEKRREVALYEESALAPGPSRLAREMGAMFTKRKLPVYVFYMPGIVQIRTGRTDTPARVQDFANLVGGKLYNASKIFTGRSISEIHDYFYPYDGHWNQKGSDLFAGYVAEKLSAVQK